MGFAFWSLYTLELPGSVIRGTMVNDIIKSSLRGAERRGNPMRLLRFARNDRLLNVYLFRSFTIVTCCVSNSVMAGRYYGRL